MRVKHMELTLNLVNRPERFPVSRLNGPGLRYVFWVQGCSVRCTPDCLNPEFLENMPKIVVPVEDMVAQTLAVQAQYGIEGITCLGGEPFDQAEALAALGKRVQAEGLSVVTYTGYTLEHLQRLAQPAWLELLAVTDLLIDGPFVHNLRSDTLRWRGSSNQRLIYLTDRYSHQEIESAPLEKGCNVLVQPDGRINVSGMQNKQEVEALLQSLRERGIIQ